jgi:hypothetical protein
MEVTIKYIEKEFSILDISINKRQKTQCRFLFAKQIPKVKIKNAR